MQRSQYRLVVGVATVASLALLGVAGGAHAGGKKKLETRLKGYSEVPAVSTAATGRFKATIDEASGSIAVKSRLFVNALYEQFRLLCLPCFQRLDGGLVT